MRRLCMFAALFASIFLGALASAGAPARAPVAASNLTPQQWRDDLHFMAAEMKARHANLFHRISEPEFDSAVADLDRRIPQLQRNQVIVGMMRIAAMIGDGHTRIEPRKDAAFRFRSLPLKLYWFDDGVYVRAAAPEFRDVVGARVEAVGGVPIAEAIPRISAIVSSETVSGPRLFVPLYLAMPDVLQALGLSESTGSATLTVVKSGQRRTVSVPAGQVAPPWPGDTDVSLVTPDGWVDARTGPQPMWMQAPLDPHRMIVLPDQSALYVQLNTVADTKDETLTQFGDRILAQVHASNPSRLILDLRLDQGGNGDLRNAFVADLIRATGGNTRLFVLVGRGTFSASQFILDDLDRLGGALFIGEPASSRPTGYGDAYKTVMPNSGIAVRTSIKYWQSGQDMRPFTPIDVAAPQSFADYLAGRDPALEAALRYQDGSALADRLMKAAASGGPEAAVNAAKDYVDAPAHRYNDSDSKLVAAEQVMLRNKQGPAALVVARWSARRFPRNGDLATVLAYIAAAQGEKAEASSAIAAALAIDPNNRSAQSLREKIATK